MAVGLVMVGTMWGQAAAPTDQAAPTPQAVPPGQAAPAPPASPKTQVPTPATVQATAAPAAAEASGGTITGSVKAGAVPLPGVSVTATNTLTGKQYATTTDVNGSFTMAIPRNGRYVVKAELAAFATETKEVLINAD